MLIMFSLMTKIFQLLDKLREMDRAELIALLKAEGSLKIDWLNRNGLIALVIGFIIGSLGVYFWKITLALVIISSLVVIFLFLFTPKVKLK